MSPSYVKNENLFIEDCYDNSIYYDLSANGLPYLPNELGIGFINGVWNNFKSAKGGAEWRRDFVPRLDRAGAKREKDSIITLASDLEAAAFDHEFMSPTYREKLQRQIV